MKNQRLETILQENMNRVMVLEYFSLPYLDHPEMSLEDACTQVNADPDLVMEALIQVKTAGNPVFNYDFLEIPVLVAYLVNTHHEYVRSRIPLLRKLIGTLNDPGLERAFDRFSRDLNKHILLEEKIIFPFIVQLHEQNEDFDLMVSEELLKNLSGDILFASHTQDDDEMAELRKLTVGYTFQAEDSLIRRLAMHELKALETDISIHAGIEDRVLFVKARHAEQLLRGKIRQNSRPDSGQRNQK